ncbi:VOC family protein [Paenibacillus sp. HB172176]|uniref:VOC family protein n=1 Tax=Paenibacillus sp. HB172176 TaxID=2493690 RepID=UPI00143B3444|nr:VOC family protein [Paenibacillus sp. HB172176]
MKAQLTPYLMSNDARKQAEFYKNALGGEIVSVMTHNQTPGIPEELKDKVMHLVLTVAGGNTLFFSDSFEGIEASRSLNLSLGFQDETEARSAFANLCEGGTEKFPLQLQPWGAMYGEAVDKFGVTWMIVTQ